MTTIRPKERDAIIQSLRAGVVPRVGQEHIQVGRAREVAALLKDVERVSDGGSAFRLVIGEYGSGKTFFLNLIRSIALEKKFVVGNADLNPDRRFHATGGQARSLYAELMRNISTRTKPDGGAVPAVVERFIIQTLDESRKRQVKPEQIIREKLEFLKEMVNGYDFAEVISIYWKGHEEGNDTLKANTIRWLRAEYASKMDVRHDLGIRSIIDDSNGYDFLKLFARFVRLAGFSGLLICFDELVNLYKITNAQARTLNYEQVLRILNDSLQGSSVGLGILMGGTPEFLMDPRRGLFSYSALQSRLAENTFVRDGLVDMSGPVLRLSNLSQEEFLVLLEKIRHVFAYEDSTKHLVPDEALTLFMAYCSKKIGQAYFRTPRNTIKAFVNLLSVIEQNPGTEWRSLLEGVAIPPDTPADLSEMVSQPDAATGQQGEDELTTFKLGS